VISRGSVNDPSSVCEAHIGTLVVRLHLPLLFLNADQPFHWCRPPFYTLGPHRQTQTTSQHRRLRHSTWRQLELHVSDLGLLNLQSTCHPMRRPSMTITMTSSTRRKQRQMGPVLIYIPQGGILASGSRTSTTSPMHATNFSTRQIRLPISRHFSTLPHVPGRPKSHMSCNLCA